MKIQRLIELAMLALIDDVWYEGKVLKGKEKSVKEYQELEKLRDTYNVSSSSSD